MGTSFVTARAGTPDTTNDSSNVRQVSVTVGATPRQNFPSTVPSSGQDRAVPQANSNDLTITHASGLSRPPSHGITADVRAILSHLSIVQRHKFERASANFPAFCQDWERRLHDREVNNLEHINWQKRGGYQTATYVAYGKVQACDTKESSRGVPIGKLSYQEYNYYLTGKTVDEARHTAPKLVSTTNTLEIFSWDKNRWFY
jgi:hypothetical protein